MLVLIGGTALITYTLTSRSSTPVVETPASEPSTPASSAGDSAVAKERLCAAFLQTTKGSTGRGGVVSDGELNTANVLRIVASVVTIQRATTNDVAPDVAELANAFVDGKLALANAALANESIEELVRLNGLGNEATRNLADACGIAY
ncbi:hypothetical protein [Mycolicibacterium brumae]|uniref:hypothetical protein n=1 Tax=Mycolicibacterium brumae TaxID=85968 RepID=UPI000FE1FFF4|nr:hypothetical protein [Mycolicibacterium brumae]MCV7191373.1 hypothetical protein [Mycolicibacterium brumae]UWW08168.1 hypothetical protein L2Z93_001211 [Mycolicibacterium brumae]